MAAGISAAPGSGALAQAGEAPPFSAQSSHSSRAQIERLGLRWTIDPTTTFGRALLETGAWQPSTTRALLRAARPGMRVLDAGAGGGWFTALLAKAVGPTGHVFACEPVPAHRLDLDANLRANGLTDRVTVLPFGLSDARCRLPIELADSTATLHGDGAVIPLARELVELRTLDEIAAELSLDQLDLVKVALEGHEPAFLRGAAGTLARCRPLLSLALCQRSLHAAGSDVRHLLALLHALDYEACREDDDLPFASDLDLLRHGGSFERSARVLARPVESLAGMPVRLHRDIGALRHELGLPTGGVILEDDIDVAENDCELHGRKRRDAEVLCALAASFPGPCLDLGTSHGRSAFKLATNVGRRHPVFTVNMLPEHAAAAGTHITHVLDRDAIGSYCRAHGLANVVQVFADTARWQPPPEVSDLALAFVDACHDADAVLTDSRLAWARLRPGGHLVWHDFSPTQRARHAWIDSVMRGVAAFLRSAGHRGPVHHLRGSWIGFVRKEVT